MEILLKILAFLYLVTGIIAIIAYLPTILDLTKKIASANIHSYALWTFCAAISFLYALLIVSDFLLELVTGLNFAACVIILILSLRLKYSK